MGKNLTPTEYKMLMMSMEYIANHPHATMEAVPSNLLKFWSVPHFTDKPKYEDSSLQVLVFIFVLRSYYWKGEEISVFLDTVRFNLLFFSFQIVLTATLHCRDAKLKAEPFSIFHIPEYKTPDFQDTEVLLSSYEAITERTSGYPKEKE